MSEPIPLKRTPEPDASGTSSRALERVVTSFRGLLDAASARLRLDPAERDALVQELRIRLWRALGDDGRIGSVSASYIHRTVMSAALDLLRRRRVREQALPDDDYIPAMALRSTDRADVRVETNDLMQAVERALLGLPDSRRAVVRLHLRGYHRDVIARLLGWTEAKTRNLLYRGLDDLRAELARLGYDPEARQ
ncbi:MAG: sigma-70 family RNA polymerase sigma factor [Gemmatimonadaceae bacterium]|nr:sigma-70 family RNA polymerase sigma factor [Gemmatimonadaceae bacterium]